MIRESGRRQDMGMGLVLNTVARLAIAAALIYAVVPLSASAQQTLNDALKSKVQPGKGNDKLVVEARELVYDNDKNTVTALGEVNLFYQGRLLEADKVIYDRNTKRVFAVGNARLTETNGTVATGDRFELTDDFKDGFIDSLRVQTADKTRFSAPRAERTGGETIVFEKGTYTACEACKKDPSRPPLWQVRAARIIQNNTERMIYYEDATLEFAGIPVAYIPFFSTPDPTVKRKSGFLAPKYIASTALGSGVSLPYFINIAPNMDVTLTPTGLTRQGFLGEFEFRHRLMTGAYSIRAAGIFQQDKSAFLPSPFGARDKDFRGSLETTGKFFLNKNWQYGFDIAMFTDKFFLQNYKIRSESVSKFFFRESTSTLFLQGKSDTAFFDLRGYYFAGLSSNDFQKQQPVVHPVLDYNKRLNGPGAIGGEVALDFNLTSLTRDAAAFQQIPRQIVTLFEGRFYSCSVFQKGSCLVRGIGGTTTRASAEISWRRNFVDPLGQVWVPFASARIDGNLLSANTTSFLNQNVSNFIDTNDDFQFRAMPAIGVEYRYPFVATPAGWGTHTIEPIAQIIVRPNEMKIGKLPNEDAQSLVFDDTTIFEWNKFSGYDRIEGGVRANYGAKYSVTTEAGGYGDLLFGQSYQIAGVNSFQRGDIANVGLDSGLDTRASDYVGRFLVAPSSALSFTARSRFDERTFGLNRLELQSNALIGPLTTSVIYARYAAQPQIGIPQRREGLLTSAAWKITPNWSVNGSVLFDLDRYLQERDNFVTNPLSQPFGKSSPFSVAALSLGAGYSDECTTFAVQYTSTFKDNTTGTKERDQTILLRLELRTLGQASVRQSLGSGTTSDGINQ